MLKNKTFAAGMLMSFDKRPIFLKSSLTVVVDGYSECLVYSKVKMEKNIIDCNIVFIFML